VTLVYHAARLAGRSGADGDDLMFNSADVGVNNNLTCRLTAVSPVIPHRTAPSNNHRYQGSLDPPDTPEQVKLIVHGFLKITLYPLGAYSKVSTRSRPRSRFHYY